jgi:hypothetical protein
MSKKRNTLQDITAGTFAGIVGTAVGTQKGEIRLRTRFVVEMEF